MGYSHAQNRQQPPTVGTLTGLGYLKTASAGTDPHTHLQRDRETSGIKKREQKTTAPTDILKREFLNGKPPELFAI